ncbi:MAG TPA: redoxin family protein [Pyrinomonadaceae bacterium]
MARISMLAGLVLMLCLSARAQDGHEYAPLKEQKIDYKNWSFKQMAEGAPAVNLRDWTQGKKLALVVYFAPWCHNWKMEAPVVARLYEKYHALGFDVIAVSEYGTASDRQMFFQTSPAAYTVVVESDAREARDQTTHYGYRQLSGDTRKWGSPYNIFLVPKKLKHDGDLLTEKAWVVNGELIETEAEQFIREHLGLKPADAPAFTPAPAPTPSPAPAVKQP